MMDVLHVLFEEDVTPTFENAAEIKSAVRTSLYQNLYNQDYKYKFKASSSGGSQQEALGFDRDMELPSLPPEMQETKPYIPATDPEDLPGILDAPLG